MISEGIKAAGGIVSTVSNLIDDLHTSDEELEKIRIQEVKINSELAKGQMEVNREEAKHPSIFVAGWRPMIGWIGATAMAWQFILLPIVEVTIAIVGVDVEIPKINYQPLITLVMGMLGVGAMRSYDKMKGTDTKVVGVRNKVAKMSDDEVREEAGKWVR